MSTHLEFKDEYRRNPRMVAKSLKHCQHNDVCVNCVYQSVAEEKELIGYGESCIDLLMEDARLVILSLLKRIDLLEMQVKYHKEKNMASDRNVCFHCGGTLIWDNDFSYEDYDLWDYDGIVHVLHCADCGAEVEYYIPLGERDDSRREQGDSQDRNDTEEQPNTR